MKERKRKEAKVASRSFMSGFKDFITKGNIIDMAVGVIIGGAFGKIVSSLVNDIIMPPIGMLIGKVDFKDLVWVLKPEVKEAGEVIEAAVTMNYGMFIMMIIEFLIIAFTIYIVLTLVIRRSQFKERIEKELAEIEKANEPEEEEEEVIEEPSEEILLLREIRDSLKK